MSRLRLRAPRHLRVTFCALLSPLCDGSVASAALLRAIAASSHLSGCIPEKPSHRRPAVPYRSPYQRPAVELPLSGFPTAQRSSDRSASLASASGRPTAERVSCNLGFSLDFFGFHWISLCSLMFPYVPLCSRTQGNIKKSKEIQRNPRKSKIARNTLRFQIV